jgi:NAD-reducing hydrogenase small subunit
MNKLKLAIVCLNGCYSCHKSFLDLNKWLLNLSEQIEIVYNPSADIFEYPEKVDIVLVEGSILTKEKLEFIKTVRDRSKILISFGDCAVNNHLVTLNHPVRQIRSFLQSCYLQTTTDIRKLVHNESEVASALLKSVQPIQTLIDVDAYLTECPPNINRVRAVLEMLLMGEISHLMGEQIRFI